MIKLQKKTDRDFIVLNLSDPQLGDGEWAPEHNNHKILERTVRELCDRIHPDLITVSGDLAWAGSYAAYEALADFLDSTGVHWAPVWGNHDNQGGPEMVDKVVEGYLRHPLCVYEKGDPAFGNGNYVIEIEENGKTVSAVIMMDSHDRAMYTNEKGEMSEEWAKLIPEQILWYGEQCEALAAKGCKDSSLIMHIPIYAYRPAFAAAYSGIVEPDKVKPEESADGKFWNEGYKDSLGVKYEGICSYPADEGAFDEILKHGHTKYLIAGHDHVNNYMVTYEGVRLIYSLKAGPGCYWTPILNGGTVLTIGSDGIKEAHHEFVDVSDML